MFNKGHSNESVKKLVSSGTLVLGLVTCRVLGFLIL